MGTGRLASFFYRNHGCLDNFGHSIHLWLYMPLVVMRFLVNYRLFSPTLIFHRYLVRLVCSTDQIDVRVHVQVIVQVPHIQTLPLPLSMELCKSKSASSSADNLPNTGPFLGSLS
ncbi:uncharacterized protein YALI1_C19976g [Yarrowia lipolytica]|uniref:Uncharacterized protein n=1 Tax=Yarrowia lipolytica TaxID=4952 RepID=A0A1D8NB64_YARLL|nr:hypothetical protein YALI1_C19976g [Yarrowia lipolytica]